MGVSREARQTQGQQLLAGANGTLGNAAAPGTSAAPEVIGPPLPLQFDAAALSAVSGVDERVAEWERLHLKDGATVTVEERLVLVAHILSLRGLPPKRISYIIGHAFFSNSGDERNADNLKENRVNLVYATPGTAAVLAHVAPVPGTARVVFSNGASSSFTGPATYTGLDTNEREARVGLARNSYRTGGRRAGYGGGGSMISDRQAELRAAFLADDVSKPVRDKVGTPAFQAAYQDFIYDRVLNGWAEKVAVQNIPLLQAWVDANPAPPTVTPAWTQQLGTEAMRLILGYNNRNVFAKAHSTWYVEDEAAAQILVERVQPGMTVNFDVDTRTVR